MNTNTFFTNAIFLYITFLVSSTSLSNIADAKIPIPAKATVSCKHCSQLKEKANIIEKTLASNPESVDKDFEAIIDTQKAISEFLTLATTLNEKEMEALLRAWSVVSVQDSHVSIPTHSEIRGKLSDEQFDKIQSAASEMASRYCQSSKTETPRKACSPNDQKIKKSYMAISLSILQALSEKENPPQDE